MKEPFFNDLSLSPLCASDEEVKRRLSSFANVLKFCGFLGFKKVRFDRPPDQLELKPGCTLQSYLSQNAKGNQNDAILLLSMLMPPYINGGTVAKERYDTHDIRLKVKDQELVANGLACAFFSDGFAVGFDSEDLWRNNILFELRVKDLKTNKTHDRRVFCISSVAQFGEQPFVTWSVNNLSLHFRPSNLSIDSKRVRLRHDHGEDKLRDFADSIKKEPYIIEVINSLPFVPKAKKMTKLNGDSSLIEIRLLETREKIGIVVRTTAADRIEAMYLAADIERKYA